MSTTTLTETKPTEKGWYWFLPNGKSPKSLNSRVAKIVIVSDFPAGDLWMRFNQMNFMVSEMGGLWSERLDDPEIQG